MKKDLKTRADIFLLVSLFYEKVREDKDLGPFFSRIKDWDDHLEKLTDFWESSLFLKRTYLGDPLQAHIKADKDNNNNTISEFHFGLWLNLWFHTINENFEGEYAQNAKHRAQKMSTFLNLKIYEARQAK